MLPLRLGLRLIVIFLVVGKLFSVLNCVGIKGSINYQVSFISWSSHGHSLVSPGKPVLWCVLAQLHSSSGTFLSWAMSAGYLGLTAG